MPDSRKLSGIFLSQFGLLQCSLCYIIKTNKGANQNEKILYSTVQILRTHSSLPRRILPHLSHSSLHSNQSVRLFSQYDSVHDRIYHHLHNQKVGLHKIKFIHVRREGLLL